MTVQEENSYLKQQLQTMNLNFGKLEQMVYGLTQVNEEPSVMEDSYSKGLALLQSQSNINKQLHELAKHNLRESRLENQILKKKVDKL